MPAPPMAPLPPASCMRAASPSTRPGSPSTSPTSSPRPADLPQPFPSARPPLGCARPAMTRLDSYIFRQLAIALLAVTTGLAALVWLTQSLRFIELVLDRGLSFMVFIELTGLLLPTFFAVILPITTFVVTLFVYVRLAADRELVVMRAAGLSQWRLARPALAPASLAVLICYALNLWLVPASQAAFRAWQYEIRNQLAAILVQEGVFSSVGDDLTVY